MFPYRLDAEITLDLLAPRHAQELYDVVDRNREQLRPWMPWVDTTRSVDDIKAFIATTLSQVATDNGFHTAIRAHGRIVGIIGVHRIDWANKSTSLGYWLAQDAQGKGIMTRACTAYIDYLFGELQLHRIEIHCATENLRSRAIPERLGFASEGIARDAEWVNDRFVSHVVYSLLSSEWRRGSASS
ncbi:MAG TPA: GNAT family protein [Gammaproteobacteria bacterium]